MLASGLRHARRRHEVQSGAVEAGGRAVGRRLGRQLAVTMYGGGVSHPLYC